MTCNILTRPARYDDHLIAHPRPIPYAVDITSDNNQGDIVNVIGTKIDTPEGQVRQRLAGLLAEAVAAAVRKPGSNNSAEILDLIDRAAHEASELRIIEHKAAPA